MQRYSQQFSKSATFESDENAVGYHATQATREKPNY